MAATIALEPARAKEATAVAELLNAAADMLTVQYGIGFWSRHSTDRGVKWLMRIGQVYVVREQGSVIATLTLTPRKPWAIDIDYFTQVAKAMYVLSMAVAPDRQSRGIGRACVDAAVALCREASANALRLDAFDANAGAGAFYQKCGFRDVGRVRYRNVPLIYFERMV
jgi:GNAT superfamily N-acetyltransferase